MNAAQATVVRAFGLGTGAWALWIDLDHKKVRIRHYDARMVIPLTWDEDGVTECAFVTRAFYRGKAVDLTFDVLINELDLSMKFAPALRTNGQIEAFRVALQMLGNLTGFGISYFDIDESRGYLKTTTEVSSDNSAALLRNIRRHENNLEGTIVSIGKAVMRASRSFGETIPDESITRIQFDDSIIQDTAAEKEQGLREVGFTMGARVPTQAGIMDESRDGARRHGRRPRSRPSPVDLHAARCPHGRPDPRPTAPLPMARPTLDEPALAWLVRTARRQINSTT